MDKVCVTLRLLFEDPFWIAIFEKRQEGKLSVCKVTFGAEPKDYEINEFIHACYYNLRFSPSVDDEAEGKEKVNPKRRQREVKKQLKNTSLGTRSQQALKLQQEEGKLKRKALGKKRSEEKKEFQFVLKQQKRKEKHKGR
ncbi:MAG: YjdF family protein [Velocimicrobium sp.]